MSGASSELPEAVDLGAKLALFDERWSPKLIAQVNDCDVKLAKLEGEFIWHSHPDEDELFLLITGSLELRFRWPEPPELPGEPSAEGEPRFREHSVTLAPGQLIVVPRGVEHLPVAPAESGGASVLLFEPTSTLNTGQAGGDRTVRELDRI